MTGKQLKKARNALGLTQEELARHLGKAANTIARWEREELEIPIYLKLALIGLEIELERKKK